MCYTNNAITVCRRILIRCHLPFLFLFSRPATFYHFPAAWLRNIAMADLVVVNTSNMLAVIGQGSYTSLNPQAKRGKGTSPNLSCALATAASLTAATPPPLLERHDHPDQCTQGIQAFAPPHHVVHHVPAAPPIA